MSFQVDMALVNQFRANFEIQFQQSTSRLRGCVNTESQNGEFQYFDRILPTTMTELTTRHADTPLVSTSHDRRRIGLRDFSWAELVDWRDLEKMLLDPTSTYIQNAIRAANQTIDDIIISAAFGTAYAGKAGATTVAFGQGYTAGSLTVAAPTENSLIAQNYVDSGAATNSNLTISKIRHAQYLLQVQEVNLNDDAMCYAVISPKAVEGLLRQPEFTSADYNTQRMLARSGKNFGFMGFEFVISNRLPVTSNIRDCLFFEKRGLNLSIGKDISTRVDNRPDKNNAAQPYVGMGFGASRMWEAAVLKVQVDETK